jgi:hypothetical protein
MRSFILALTISALGMPALAGAPSLNDLMFPAADPAKLACLQDRVAVIGTRVWPESRTVGFRVHNQLGWGISAITVRVIVKEDGRSTPWFDKIETLYVKGGIEPREMRDFNYEFPMPEGRDWLKLTPTVEVLDVLDSDEHQLLGTTYVALASGGKSAQTCEYPDGM